MKRIHASLRPLGALLLAVLALQGLNFSQSGTKAVVDQIRLCILRTFS